MAAQHDPNPSLPEPVQEPELDPGSERRAHPRQPVDCPVEVALLMGDGHASGRMTDLSLGGCLVAAKSRVGIASQARVEVTFQLRGLTFRVAGIAVGARNLHAFAIRFVQVPAHRLQELATALAEVAAAHATHASRQAAALSAGAPGKLRLVPDAQPMDAKRQSPGTSAPAVPSVAEGLSGAERRTNSRHAVDTRASLLLINTGITMAGRILDLSLGGCQIRMEERFRVGIYVRVEAEFYLHGLPFRIAGVSQAIVDNFTIGVRFLDLSPRRRDQLAELIAEMDDTVNLPEEKTSSRLFPDGE